MANATKEVYELWWEYLKRSDKYKKYCELIDPGKRINRKRPEFRKIFNNPHFLKINAYWGDVHNSEFDHWWDNRAPMLTQGDAVLKLQDVILRKDLNTIRISVFTRKNNRPPDMVELFNLLEDAEFIFVRINTCETIGKIIKQVKNLVKTKKQMTKSSDYAQLTNRNKKRYYSEKYSTLR